MAVCGVAPGLTGDNIREQKDPDLDLDSQKYLV